MINSLKVFMKKELTCLPSFFSKHISKHYNNTIGNCLTWAFCIWLLFHFLFHKSINGLLRQMKYPEYYRERVTSSLWNFGFSFFSFVYCFVVLTNHDFQFSDLKAAEYLSEGDGPVRGQYVLGSVILGAFYAEGVFWEVTRSGRNDAAAGRAVAAAFGLFAYVEGWAQMFFALVAVFSLGQSTLEMGKILSFQIVNRPTMKILSEFWFVVHCVMCFILNFVILPLQFLIPCGKNFKNDPSPSVLVLNVLLWTWFAINLSDSVIFRMAKHYVYHMGDVDTGCGLPAIECCMFPKRTDVAYRTVMVKRRIETRKELECLGRQKPNKAALYQTLKVMMTMKRKLKRKRSTRDAGTSSDPASPSDESSSVAGEVVDSLLDRVDEQTN